MSDSGFCPSSRPLGRHFEVPRYLGPIRGRTHSGIISTDEFLCDDISKCPSCSYAVLCVLDDREVVGNALLSASLSGYPSILTIALDSGKERVQQTSDIIQRHWMGTGPHLLHHVLELA